MSLEKSNTFDFFIANLDKLGFTDDQKNSIYFILSAILNLGNIQFQNDDSSCFTTNETKMFLSNAAFCLGIDKLDLEDALTNVSREVAKQIIK